MTQHQLNEIVTINQRVRAASMTKPAWHDVEPGTYIIVDVSSDPADKGSEVVVLRPAQAGTDLPPLITRTTRGQTALGDLV